MTDPSDSSVQPLAKFCTCHETHPMECEGCRINRERAEARRAALPLAASDEQNLPPLPQPCPLVLQRGWVRYTAEQMREYALAARAIPVAELRDEQILDVASYFGFIGSREELLRFCRALLRHSEGKE